MTTQTELQTLALKIARHRWPGVEMRIDFEGWPTYGPIGDRLRFAIDNDTAYEIWQEIAPKYVEKVRQTRYHNSPTKGGWTQIANAKAIAYEASRTPLGIAQAYCEVYGLED